LLGHSAGGHLALWLAAHSRTPVVESGAAPLPFRPRGAVALAGVVDLRRASALGLGRGAAHDLLGGPPEAVPDRYRAASPAERLPVRVPQVLVHGEEDDVVPLEIATSYVDAARASGDDVRLVALPGTGHFELIDPQTRAWPAVLEAVRGLLN
jgi:dipeptidyl aminopeptidase/acylaminoacyl peptidase